MPEGLAPELTSQMRRARRLLESIPNVTLLADLRWFDSKARWGVKCRMEIAASSEYVPAISEWWVLIETNYPWGDIRFYPAKDNSITATFPHQKYNGFEIEQWRSGELCLRSPLFSLKRAAYDVDPLGDPNRLLWHFERAKEWLTAAAEGKLLSDGDAYELPAFPSVSDVPVSIATFEDENTFAVWSASQATFGVLELVEIHARNQTTFVATKFSDLEEEILSYPIGTYLKSGDPGKFLGAWIRSDDAPILPPHQVPRTWGDFRESCPGLWSLLQRVSGSLRDGMPHFLLIGFPIPSIVGEAPRQMHWQPILLPPLAYGEQHANGFRAHTEQGYWRLDIAKSFRESEQIDWQEAENWSTLQTTARGRFTDSLASQTIGILGVGAIGSHVSELLVRGGVDKAVLVDGDILSNGNLCRHTLGLGAIDRSKAHIVMARLNSARATTTVEGIQATFPKLQDSSFERLASCSIIVDCTGSDEVLHELSQYCWPSEKLFCSFSIGYYAKRAYVYLARGTTLPFEEFQQEVSPWLARDMEAFANVEPSRENLGCWHISFPARVDQIVMAAAAAVRCMEEWAKDGFTKTGLHVFEQDNDGIRRIQSPGREL